jgi:serine/threonine protein kinase
MIKEIIHGGFSIFYLPEEPRTKPSVSLKILKRIALSEEERFRFMQEVEIIASINYPTLLTLPGFVPVHRRAGDLPAIVTDFMPHGSYNELIAAERKGKPPSGWDARSRFMILYGTVAMMKILHWKQIIHRDLNHVNLFMNEGL